MDGAEGRVPFAALAADERTAEHALVDARIAELATSQSFGSAARAAGHATVPIDADGNLIEIAADGNPPPALSHLDLIAGPNGAGKTTLYERAIRPARPGLPFVNADQIARDRSPG